MQSYEKFGNCFLNILFDFTVLRLKYGFECSIVFLIDVYYGRVILFGFITEIV